MRIRGVARLAPKMGDGHQRASQPNGPIAGMVLYGVTGFVSGDAYGRDGGLIIHAVGQGDHIGAGVKMVGEISPDMLETDARHLIAPEHLFGSHGASQSPAVQDLGIFGIGGFHHHLCNKGQEDGRKHKRQILKVKVHIRHNITPST